MSATKRAVGVIGFGYVGTVIGACLAARGYDVTAIDVNPDVVRDTNSGKTAIYEPGLSELLREAHAMRRIRATTRYEAIRELSYVIVTVGTPLGADLTADLTHIKQAAAQIGSHLRPGATVLLKSTVVPGITRGLFGSALSAASGLQAGKDFFLAFSPERIAEGRAVSEFQSFPIVVGADDEQSLIAASTFWEEALGVKTIRLHSSVGAELVKLADNVWIDVNIALANQISRVCHAFHVDADEVIAAANTLPKGQHYVNLLQSSVGVGGSCLTKDPHFFAGLVEDSGGDGELIRQARAVNDGMPKYTAGLITTWLKEHNVSRDAKVGLFGLSFKNNTSDLRFTPVKPLIDALRAEGIGLAAFDPHVNPDEALRLFDLRPAADAESVASGAHVLCFACWHEIFRGLDLKRLAELASVPCLLVDGRHGIAQQKAVAAGFHYISV